MPSIRSRIFAHRPLRLAPPDSEYAEQPLAIRTFAECAAIMGVCHQRCRQLEKAAFKKLAADEVMQRLFVEGLE